jgi:NMD protein affecting ribosome stability and mRNA decay
VQDDCITIALGLSELRVVGEEETNREIKVEVGYRRQVAMCPRCGQMTAKVHSTSAQTKKGQKAVGQACLSRTAQTPLPLSGLWEGVH